MAPTKSDLSFDDLLRAGLGVPLRNRTDKETEPQEGAVDSEEAGEEEDTKKPD